MKEKKRQIFRIKIKKILGLFVRLQGPFQVFLQLAEMCRPQSRVSIEVDFTAGNVENRSSFKKNILNRYSTNIQTEIHHIKGRKNNFCAQNKPGCFATAMYFDSEVQGLFTQLSLLLL